jgi:hypothetical protein
MDAYHLNTIVKSLNFLDKFMKMAQDWDNFHPNRKKALVEKVWPTEIQCYTEQKDILKTILDQKQ